MSAHAGGRRSWIWLSEKILPTGLHFSGEIQAASLYYHHGQLAPGPGLYLSLRPPTFCSFETVCRDTLRGICIPRDHSHSPSFMADGLDEADQKLS
jgi:hypothetical protein